MGKANFDISKQKYEDLINVYKKVAPHCWSQKDAYVRTVEHPAPRYYVSPKQAYQRIALMMRGDFDIVDMLPREKKEMYYSLFDEVIRLSEQRSFIGKSLWTIVQFAVLQPAPRFFIGWDRAKRIRIWLKKGYFDENGKVMYEKVRYYETRRDKYHTDKEKKRKWMLEKMSQHAGATGQ